MANYTNPSGTPPSEWYGVSISTVFLPDFLSSEFSICAHRSPNPSLSTWRGYTSPRTPTDSPWPSLHPTWNIPTSPSQRHLRVHRQPRELHRTPPLISPAHRPNRSKSPPFGLRQPQCLLYLSLQHSPHPTGVGYHKMSTIMGGNSGISSRWKVSPSMSMATLGSIWGMHSGGGLLVWTLGMNWCCETQAAPSHADSW